MHPHRRPLLSPFLGGLDEPPITDDMRAAALVATRDVLSKLESMRRELGLEAAAFETIVDVYIGSVQARALEALRDRERARRKRFKEKLRAARAEAGQDISSGGAAPSARVIPGPFSHRGHAGPPPAFDLATLHFNGIDDDDDDDEEI